jgi:hypothetical protein
MDRTYWSKQTVDQPLFPDLEWSRPQTKAGAGKLLIVGGNAHGFVAAATAFNEAEKAGAGSVQMLLPDSLRKLVGKTFMAGEFAASTPSGSFGQNALVEVLTLSQWAEGVLLAGDLGRNSETAILIEKFLTKFQGHVTITQDAVDYVMNVPEQVLGRPATTLVLSFAQLQKLAKKSHYTAAFTFEMYLLRLEDTKHAFTQQHALNIVTKHLDTIFVAVDGEVSSTRLAEDPAVWRVKTAAHAAVWWMQNPTRSFQALTAAVAGVFK